LAEAERQVREFDRSFDERCNADANAPSMTWSTRCLKAVANSR
jgi:hypothetical protein